MISEHAYTSTVPAGCSTLPVAPARWRSRLASDVAEVLAVDQEPEAIEFGKHKAQRLGVNNIQWIAAAAEDAPLEGVFRLVSVGNAFHRLDRDAVATRLVRHLPDGGCAALFWGGTPWRGTRAWQRVLSATLERWKDAGGCPLLIPRRGRAASRSSSSPSSGCSRRECPLAGLVRKRGSHRSARPVTGG
jgi:hypothetical protein